MPFVLSFIKKNQYFNRLPWQDLRNSIGLLNTAELPVRFPVFYMYFLEEG